MIYLVVLVKFILSDVYIETEPQLLILHGLSRQDSLVTASMSRGGGQLVVMVQKLYFFGEKKLDHVKMMK